LYSAKSLKQKFYYWYVIVSAVIAVLTFIATVIEGKGNNSPNKAHPTVGGVGNS
jgi:hypothetical protein